jgi:UDP-N-acetylglucosamine--N-acetylmuramyl-(pentapeptide) pyrophosphoryl-undecaprenol N-acetylglucosamine transferase
VSGAPAAAHGAGGPAPTRGSSVGEFPVIVTGGGTGGHLYPGLAIARALVRAEPRARPFFVGARRGIEREVLPTTEFPHLLLDLHPVYRQRPWENWRTLAGGVLAWRALGALFAARRPRAVIGTGGYAAGAALGYAVARGVPAMLQEADSFPGSPRGCSRVAPPTCSSASPRRRRGSPRGASRGCTRSATRSSRRRRGPPDGARRAAGGASRRRRSCSSLRRQPGARALNDALALGRAGSPGAARVWATGAAVRALRPRRRARRGACASCRTSPHRRRYAAPTSR